MGSAKRALKIGGANGEVGDEVLVTPAKKRRLRLNNIKGRKIKENAQDNVVPLRVRDGDGLATRRERLVRLVQFALNSFEGFLQRRDLVRLRIVLAKLEDGGGDLVLVLAEQPRRLDGRRRELGRRETSRATDDGGRRKGVG